MGCGCKKKKPATQSTPQVTPTAAQTPVQEQVVKMTTLLKKITTNKKD